MLQPRLNVCGRMPIWSFVLFALFLSSSLITCQDLNHDEEIESTRTKREGVPENRDLTVLLVNQKRTDYNTKIGRYHSVKPLIGLLTSTARTFIQDGVTTEFATQILGTTLDNGRIYAQLLTKSSLVLYNKPSNADDPIIVKPTRVHSAFDGEWNVKQDLGFIDPEKFVLKNTDYLAPSSKMDIVYASQAVPENLNFWVPPSSPENQAENIIFEEPVARRVQPFKEIPRYVQNEALNYLDGPYIAGNKNFEYVVNPSVVNKVNTLHRENKAYEPATEQTVVETNTTYDVVDPVNIVKVKANYDLPTFTIKNEFSPIFYYIDNVESHRPHLQEGQQTKTPKKLFGQKSEPRPKKTFTYEGFADFTTVVGDTVIIFTPNTETSKPHNPAEVNVFPSAKRVDKLSTKITFLAADIPVATATFKANETPSATKIAISSEENQSEKALFNDRESLKKVLYEVDDKIPESITVQYNNGFDFNLDVIQPSESPITSSESTRTPEELAVIPIQGYRSRPTEPLATLSPTSTIIELPQESVVTERDVTELFSNSEEESENTAAEVTERTEEEDEGEEEVTTETPEDIITTTESGHSEESVEDFETTTESKFIPYESQENTNEDNQEDTQIVCTEGLETQSTMTTAYKTLTYLTTYFIPLESTETTTSIKSDVVVESDVGYITNVVCRTQFDIEPTTIYNSEVSYSLSTEQIEIEKESKVSYKASTETDIVTEANKVTSQQDLAVYQEQNPDTNENNENSEEMEPVESAEGKESTSVTTTTTERVTTSEESIEVHSEHSSFTTTEKPTTHKPESEESEEDNEIDVIYKTLYTTYTYFTTFFGDQTSSIASHKSVVTNVITSTVDLSKLDPSLLGVLKEDGIAPTSVGINNPIEPYASIIDLVKNKDVIESVEVDNIYSSQTPTPSLGDDIVASIKPDAVKTYYTTYTFFTTIYVGTDANICSRNEVYTNYVGPDELVPTKVNPSVIENTRAQFDFRNCKQVKLEQPSNHEEHSSMESSVSMEEDNVQSFDGIKSENTVQPTPIEVDMLFSVESNPLESENSFVTDVKSSSSKGERKILDSNNIILDDQISSESNIEEIVPSPTLLLQTSYTTFTYFTTMYIGKDSSKVKSHLETITNVVTETIMPNKEPEEESNLPITYYTTFTYWTTLYKDKSTTITSREEIVSNVVTPMPQVAATISPIDTTPIDVDNVLPPKDLEIQLKPSLVEDNLEQDDGKATFYTTYTYFTTFYTGNTSQVRSSLETVTRIYDNTQLVEDNQLGRKVPVGSPDQNLIQDGGEKSHIKPSVVKEEIIPTKLPDASSAPPSVLIGTYIDNLFAEVKPDETPATLVPEKKILYSQVAVIAGDSTIVTSDNKSLPLDISGSNSPTTTEDAIISPTPQVIESSVSEPEITTEAARESEEEEEDNTNTRKKSRLTFTPKKPSSTPVIIPFASRNRPTFIPKRVPLSNGATTITRSDFTPPVITATPSLKSVKPTGYNGNRKAPTFSGSSSISKRFPGRSSVINPSANVPSASRVGGFGQRGSIQPTSRRTGFRSSSIKVNSLDYISRSAVPRIRPTASSRLPPGRSRASASVTFAPQDQDDETFATQQEENVTEALEEITEAPTRTTNNPLLRFRRPPITRQPGTAITPRPATSAARRSSVTTRGRLTTTTRRSTTRSTANPLLSLRRQRPNSLFPRRNLFKQPDPEPEDDIKEDELKVDESEEPLDEEDFDDDTDYDSSDRKERQVPTPSTAAPKKNIVQIRPFAFRRRIRRQIDYGNRKYPNFRRPATKTTTTRRPEPEIEEPTAQKRSGRYNARSNSRSTTVSSLKSAGRQPFIVRGETRTTTTTNAPAYRRGKSSRPSARTTTSASRPKPPRLAKSSSGSRSTTSRSGSGSSSGRTSRTRTTTSRASSRQRSSFENLSGERFNYKNILDDGKITVTHQIPTEVTVPVVNGKITEYKNLLSATPSIEILLQNQVSTIIGPLGNPQLVLALESTELAENGATKIIKFLLHETPTTTVIFTPTTIRGRKTSFSHILPSTVYSVEPVTQTVAPEINANVPLANLLLSQLLLGGQQPGLNPLLALQGQGLIPQQPVVQTPVTEYKTRTTTYVTTVTDARETVLPITFRGKAILTTIVDPTTNVITATEFITDTVVTTPTALGPGPQLNSLLLPLLLQQQQQQQLALPTANPLLGLGQSDLTGLGGFNSFNNLGLTPNLNQQNNLNNDIFSNSPKPNILSDLNSNEDFSEDAKDPEDDPPPPPSPPSRRSRKRGSKPAPAAPPKQTSVVTLYVSGRHPAFNTNGIVYDNTPWRPGRDMNPVEKQSIEDERRLKNLATRIMSNGVEVLVKDKKPEVKNEQRKFKLIHESTLQPELSTPPASKKLLSSAVATVVSRQQISALFPLHQLMRHNYIIKTCMTTYTYLTTVVHNKRSAISTFETIVSVVTTESLTNLYATDIIPDVKPTKTKHMEVKTIQPSAATNMYMSVYPKIDKRIDSEDANFDLIQPSEVNSVTCTSSCPCSNTKTESLQTKFTDVDSVTKYGITSTISLAPTDKLVEKYTEVINDYSDEKESNSVEESELLTNEQAPAPIQTNKVNIKNPEKIKPDKPQKPNKNKFVVADLLKLGSLGIKGLTQLAPVIEKMTGGFIKRNDNANKTTSTTIKPEVKLTAYSANKRIDNDFEAKHSNFPIYIPFDEMETSESQIYYSNATLHQNFAWAAEHKQPKAHIVLPKIIHESPLVNGGIPISPGEIITANSDVIVGKPAVGGPLTLAASGIKLHSSINSPPIDSFVSGNEHYFVNEKPQGDQPLKHINMDESFDLRPPEPPKLNFKANKHMKRPGQLYNLQKIPPDDQYPFRMPPSKHDHLMNTEQIKSTSTVLGNHGRPVFLDYIPSLAKPGGISSQHKPVSETSTEIDVMDNSPSSSEVVNTQIKTVNEYSLGENSASNKPFLVDIQPSRVANVIIPHGSSTALVFAGSSEPHKTGDYVDDPLPYPEPGYFGSFNIDAPQMTNVHNVVLNSNKQLVGKPNMHSVSPTYKPPTPTQKDQLFTNELKIKWKDTKRPLDQNKIPPPTSNQETHVQVGPQITVYNPDTFNPNTNEFQNFNQAGGKLKIKDGKDIIDKEYENYLAVPPPPPPSSQPSKSYHSQDFYDKTKPYGQRPIVHTKPVQDMKVFLNIQHPIPEQLPPRITSEIYFASQMPNSKPTPTYTIRMPPVSYNKFNHSPSNNVLQSKPPKLGANTEKIHNSFNVISSPNFANISTVALNNNDNNTYTVTLNTATNVASNNEAGQVIGSSVAVPVSTSQSNDQFNTDIPIGTNFAIRVEDNTTPPETYYLHQGSRNPTIVYSQHSNIPHSKIESQISVGDNRWNKSTSNTIQTTYNEDNFYIKTYGDDTAHSTIQSISPSINSHANFPMINEQAYTTPSDNIQEVKIVTDSIDSNKSGDTKRPAKLIPNIPTNSHGWYSSVFNDNNINNIKVEVTTRKVIPLNYDYSDRNQVPQFGQKIASIGKPPTEMWSQKVLSGFNIGKPFTKPQSTERPYVSSLPLTTKPLNINYIPSDFGVINQPAYDIPIRDNSDETTTLITKTTTENVKPVYENSDEIYDGEEEDESPGDLEGEVSSESMKVPVVSTSNEVESVSKKSTEFTLLKDEIYAPPLNSHKHDNNTKVVIDFNPGTQTEKPFGSYNNTTLQSHTTKPIYEHPSSNPYMKPRPFTINNAIVLDHQLHQPHWQINHMVENSTNVSYEDNIDLNIGEEIEKPSSAKPFSTSRPIYTTESVYKYKQPPRSVYENRMNNTHVHNESIITSIVHIQDKKPLIIKNVTEKTTLPTSTLSNLGLNRSSTEIIDLSPPPPTLDYNFKPSTNDEMIMGMSPPPPRTSPGIRLPSRVPLTPRPAIPPRTLPPYRKPPRPIPSRVTTQRPVRKPINNDEVSTYRPAFDLLNGIRRPSYNRDQPSSLLLPPPREIPSRIAGPVHESIAPAISLLDKPKIVFPTPISSGWLTSPASDFSSRLEVNIAPTSVQFPATSQSSRIPESTENPSSEIYYSYEAEISSEQLDETISNKSVRNDNNVSKEITTESTTTTSKMTPTAAINDSVQEQSYEWSSVEVPTTDKLNVISLGNKNRTRKPYPIRSEQKKNNTNRFKLPPKVPVTLKPNKILPRPEILYPTRPTPNKNILRPYPRPVTIIESSVIESSEQSIDASFVKPTEVLKSSITPTVSQVNIVSLEQSEVSSIPTPTIEEVVKIQPTHHAGNEVKISDEFIPTKTEFRTTVVTLTKTLSEPPLTISSIGYVNLTHTLTVTHTKTSLISQSEGAKTQTLVLTNTHTSTIVDVVTEVYTQVQPTTIIETVTKHIPIPQVHPTLVQGVVSKTKIPLDDVTMSSEESENFIIRDSATTDNIIQKIEHDADNETDNDTFFVVMNKSQNGGQAPPINTDVDTGDYDVTRNEQVSNNGVSQVLFGEILLAGTPYLETTNVNPNGAYGKECQPDCKASRNERCQRIDGIMKCICRPGFARMFPDRPCKPTYTYSVKLALGSHGNDRLIYNEHLADNSSKQYHALAVATHEGITRMVMQSDLRDVYHGVHITSFHPVEFKSPSGDLYQGVMNDFYVQLSDNAHESRLKEVFEKYLRNNNYSLGGTEVHAAGELMDKLDVSDFDECLSGQFHDCSEHAQCFNLRGTYTCSCLEGFADLSVNTLYPGRICSAEPVGCERCNYHGACYSRDDRRVLCECFQWYSGSACQINLKVVLISLVVCGALLLAVLAVCAVLACSRRSRTPPHPQRSIVACIQGMPSLHQGAIPKQRADRRALISERGESGDAASLQNASLPYIPAKQHRSSTSKKCVMSDPPAHDPPPPPAPAVMIPRARLLSHHGDSRENIARKRSLELSNEDKLISYLESGATTSNDEMRRKHSLESSYSANKDRHNKQGALVSAGFKVSTTIRPDVEMMKADRDDLSSVNKGDLEAELSRYDAFRKAYSQEDLSEWTDAERRLGELTLSEARSVGGTLPASTGRAASSTRLTHQEANTMAERDLGSTFLLPQVHLYKPDLTSDVSEFDSL